VHAQARTPYYKNRRLNIPPAFKTDTSAHSPAAPGLCMPCSGLGVCACLLASAPPFAVAAAAAAAAVAGLTRNLLGVHWCSDTAAGWVLGAVLGYVWGRTDPYGALLRKGSIAVSGSSAASVTAVFVAALLCVRRVVAPVRPDVRAVWFDNAIASLPHDAREAYAAAGPDGERHGKPIFRPRSLSAKVPMVATLCCTLALTGFYPLLLPLVSLEPSRPRMAQAAVGLGGLVVLRGASRALRRALRVEPSTHKAAYFKALTFVAVCSWTLLFSQDAFNNSHRWHTCIRTSLNAFNSKVQFNPFTWRDGPHRGQHSERGSSSWSVQTRFVRTTILRGSSSWSFPL